MSDRRDASPGTYWRVAWSKDWDTLVPWSMSGVAMPYIGSRTELNGVGMIVLGPLAVIHVTINSTEAGE